MTRTTGEPVVVSRRIEAPAHTIFRVLADPARHPEFDGSGMLRGRVPGAVIAGVGEVFVMRMHNDRHGAYAMDNHVVAYERDRRIGWEPRPGHGHPDATRPGAAWGHRWSYELRPDGTGATVVTEVFDGSRLPEEKRAEVDAGRDWWHTQMTETLDRLAALCVRPVSAELTALTDALDRQREHVLGILEGLSEEELRRPVLPSGWSCLGLLRHLTLDVERFWFSGVVAGDPEVAGEFTAGAEAHWRVPGAMSAEEVFAGYRAAVARTDAVLATATPEQEPAAWPVAIWPDWRLPDVRHIVIHVLTEVACHSGHLDATRELIDGTSWLGGDPYAG